MEDRTFINRPNQADTISQTLDVSWFHAPTGDFVLWVCFGNALNYTDLFWRAFKRSIRGWDNPLGAQLAKLPFPRTPQEIHKITNLLEQATERCGNVIFAFEGHRNLKEGPVRSFVQALLEMRSDRISVVLLDENSLEIRVGGNIQPAIHFTNGRLQYSRQEIQVYYTALGLVADQKIMEQVYSVTGGYAALVLMLGKYLPRGEVLTSVEIDFAVTSVHKSLSQEVERLDEPVRRAVLLLSLLDDFSAELVLELTELVPEQMLKYQQQSQFLLLKSDGVSHYFHPMYHKLLYAKRIFLPQVERRDFFLRAAKWQEQRGNLLQALKYYTDGGWYDYILSAFRQASLWQLMMEDSMQITQLLERVPADYMADHAEHRFILFLSLYHAGRKADASAVLDQLRQDLESRKRTPEEDRILGEVFLAYSFLLWLDSSGQYVEYFKQADRLLPGGSRYLDVMDHFPGGSVLRYTSMEPGDLMRIKDTLLGIAEQSLRLLPQTGLGKSYLACAEAHLYQNQLEGAGEYAGNAIMEAVRCKKWGVVCEANYLLMRIAMAQGELDDLLYYRDQICFYAARLESALSYSIVNTMEMHLYLYLDLPHLAESSLRHDPLRDPGFSFSANTGRELYCHAVYWTAVTKQYRPALAYMDSAIPICQDNGMWFSKIKLYILKAATYARLGQVWYAAKYLAQAYACGVGDILFSFIEVGRDLVELIDQTRDCITPEQIPAEWLEQVRSGAEEYEAHRRALSREYVRRNPHLAVRKLSLLSEKEYLSLKGVCAGQPIQQIAKSLNVEVHTIHIYLRRACKKMEAQDRAQAIEMAVTEGILEN